MLGWTLGAPPGRRIVLGSNAEVEAQATIAADLGCIDQATTTKIIDQTDHIGRMINRLQQHLNASD